VLTCQRSEAQMNFLKNRLGIVGELFGFLWKRKLWWMIPMIVVLLLFGALIVFASSSPVAPFIYTLF
ncbi:MAG: DUF5989 family protein, partial [Abditibacteriales bacterium]|nr:DUF5989 family protein [Abditibacteriales bacterium]